MCGVVAVHTVKASHKLAGRHRRKAPHSVIRRFANKVNGIVPHQGIVCYSNQDTDITELG